MTLRPFFTYFGGKWRAAPRYPKPAHDVIVEPFAGAAGYSLRHYERQVILVEKNPKVASTWKYLISATPEQVMALPLVDAGTTVNDYGLSEPERFLIGWWLNKGSAGPRLSPSAWMRNGSHADSFWGEKVRSRIAGQVEKIKHWKVIEGDFSSAPDVVATWFVDPPYQVAGKCYSSRFADYERLAAWCESRKGQVMVCENVGADWLPFRPFASIKGTAGAKRSGVSREAIWMNEWETS